MNVLLNVPYKEKDAAKARGAKWNPNIKSWYISNVENIPDFLQWLPEHNIICESLYLLKMQQECWNCGKSTNVVLLATDKSYSDSNNYQMNANLQILTYVTAMPDLLAGYMQRSWQYFRSFSRTINKSYFVNHCTECNRIQGDNFLHEIPEKAFYKKLLYQDADPISYSAIKNQFAVPIKANLPQYDEMSASIDLLMAHFETGIESRTSLSVTQSKINHLLDSDISTKDADIVIHGL